MKILTDLVAEVRTILQDTRSGSYRYTDAELVRTLNTVMREVKRMRPDAYVESGDLDRIEVPTYTEADLALPTPPDFAIEEQFYLPVVLAVVGYTQLRDDEFTVDGRAMAMIAKFEATLKGG